MQEQIRGVRIPHRVLVPVTLPMALTISQLPADVLSSILDSLTLPELVRCAHLSQSWRHTALNHPGFWRRVQLDTARPLRQWRIDLFKAQIGHNRTGPLSLTLDIDQSCGPADFRIAEDVMVPALVDNLLSRIVDLSMAVPPKLFNTFCVVLRSPAPRLERFSFEFHDRFCYVPNEMCLPAAPLLTSVHLYGAYLPPGSPAHGSYSHVHTLAISVCARLFAVQMQGIIGFLPRVRDLTLFLQDGLPDISDTLPSVVLQFVQRLSKLLIIDDGVDGQSDRLDFYRWLRVHDTPHFMILEPPRSNAILQYLVPDEDFCCVLPKTPGWGMLLVACSARRVKREWEFEPALPGKAQTYWTMVMGSQRLVALCVSECSWNHFRQDRQSLPVLQRLCVSDVSYTDDVFRLDVDHTPGLELPRLQLLAFSGFIAKMSYPRLSQADVKKFVSNRIIIPDHAAITLMLVDIFLVDGPAVVDDRVSRTLHCTTQRNVDLLEIFLQKL